MFNNTTKEIIQRIEDTLDLQGKTVSRQSLLRFLNNNHLRVSIELRVPIRYVKNVVTNQPTSLPVEAAPGGLRYAERTSDNKSLEILTVADANRLYPEWELNSNEGADYPGKGNPFVIYDPSNISAPLYPVGFDAGDTMRMAYIMQPEELIFEDDDTKPFRGELPEYASDLLYFKTMSEILFNTGDNRYGGFWTQYNTVMDLAFNYSRQEMYVIRARGEVE
jgi:hypothetical protein